MSAICDISVKSRVVCAFLTDSRLFFILPPVQKFSFISTLLFFALVVVAYCAFSQLIHNRHHSSIDVERLCTITLSSGLFFFLCKLKIDSIPSIAYTKSWLIL